MLQAARLHPPQPQSLHSGGHSAHLLQADDVGVGAEAVVVQHLTLHLSTHLRSVGGGGGAEAHVATVGHPSRQGSPPPYMHTRPPARPPPGLSRVPCPGALTPSPRRISLTARSWPEAAWRMSCTEPNWPSPSSDTYGQGTGQAGASGSGGGCRGSRRALWQQSGGVHAATLSLRWIAPADMGRQSWRRAAAVAAAAGGKRRAAASGGRKLGICRAFPRSSAR